MFSKKAKENQGARNFKVEQSDLEKMKVEQSNLHKMPINKNESSKI